MLSSNVFREKLKHKAFSPKCINLANESLLIALPRQVEDQGEGRAGEIKIVHCRAVKPAAASCFFLCLYHVHFMALLPSEGGRRRKSLQPITLEPLSHAVPISLLSHLYVCVLPQKCYSGCGSGTLELLYQAQQPQPCEEAPDHGSTMVLLTLQCVPLSWAHIQSMRCAENWLPDSRIGCKAAEGRHQILIKEDVGENKMHVEHEYLIFLFLWFVLW